MKIAIPPGTSLGLVNICAQIEKGFADLNPVSPVKLPKYTTDTLPVKITGGIIWLTDLNTIAVSDGTNWYPVTLGAHL